MHHHGDFSGGIVHSTVQVLLLIFHCSVFSYCCFIVFFYPRSLRVSQVVGASLPQLLTTTHWTWCLPYSAALWKGGIFERRGDINVHRVKQLLKEDAGGGRRADEAGVTPLHWAAINDRPEVVDLLLDSGADPNSKGDNL